MKFLNLDMSIQNSLKQCRYSDTITLRLGFHSMGTHVASVEAVEKRRRSVLSEVGQKMS